LNISGLRVDEKFDAYYVIELARPRLKYFKYWVWSLLCDWASKTKN